MVRLPRLSVTLSAYPSSELRPKTLTFFFWLEPKTTAESVFWDLLNLIHSNDKQTGAFHL